MSETNTLLQTLKKALRSRGITYRQVAAHLSLTESSVKRLFGERNISLRRLEQICQMMELRVAELVAQADSGKPMISQLSWEQENQLVSETKLLLVAVCVTNHWRVDQILEYYALSEPETIRALAQLDRLKLIELQPNNRVKLLISHDFSWIEKGPIQQFFESQVQFDFFNARFDGPRDARVFSSAMLSPRSADLMLRHIERVVSEFRQLHEEDVSLLLEDRHGTSLVIALRHWELAAFKQLRR